MMEESNNKSTASEKLLIDNASDFQFHATYLKYSDAYDNATDPEIKKQLSPNIICLQQNQIDYPTFYKKHKPVPSRSKSSKPPPRNSYENAEKTRMATKSEKTR